MKDYEFEKKKLFIKIDIEGAEYEVMPDILRYAQNITGIAIEVHFSESHEQVKQVYDLLDDLKKDFVLVHVNGNNCASNIFTASNCEGNIPRVIELSYINKNLISDYRLAENQEHPSELDTADCVGDRLRFKIIAE